MSSNLLGLSDSKDLSYIFFVICVNKVQSIHPSRKLNPMIQKDYIQRMIEQISKVLGLLMGMDVPEEKIKIINEAYAHWLKTNPDYLRKLSPDDIVEVLVRGKGFTVEQMEFLAELMAEEGKAEAENGNTVIAADLWKKTLVLFDYVNDTQQLFSFERMGKIDDIKSRLEEIR
ncbi:MAG: hypothetical protein ACI85O_003341 [Saprospiraceae bacterium]